MVKALPALVNVAVRAKTIFECFNSQTLNGLPGADGGWDGQNRAAAASHRRGPCEDECEKAEMRRRASITRARTAG